jgi:hypothetical protein
MDGHSGHPLMEGRLKEACVVKKGGVVQHVHRAAREQSLATMLVRTSLFFDPLNATLLRLEYLKVNCMRMIRNKTMKLIRESGGLIVDDGDIIPIF